MKIRLNTIALALAADQVLPIGVDLVVGEDIPVDLAQMRLDAGTADVVPDGPALPPELAAAIAEYQRCAHAALMAGVSLIALAEQGDNEAAHAVARAFVDQVELTMGVMGPDFRARQRAVFERADIAFDQFDQDDEFSGMAQSVARLAHNQEAAGSSPAPAPNHSEQTTDAPAASEDAAPGPAGLSDAVRTSASADDAAAGDQAASNDTPPPAGGAQDEAAKATASTAKPKRPAKAQPAADPGGGA